MNLRSVLVAFLLLVPATGYGFVDVNNGYIYYEAIDELVEKGVVEGYAGDLFKPDQLVSRAELVKMVIENRNSDWRQNSEASQMDCFADVAGHWSEEYVCYAKALGVVSGDDADGLFHPDRHVNFVEAAKIYNFGGAYRTDILPEEWFATFVIKLQNSKRIPQTVLNLDQYLTRAEIAELLVDADRSEYNEFYTKTDSGYERNPQVYQWQDIGLSTGYRELDGKVYYQSIKQFVTSNAEQFKLHQFELVDCVEDYGFKDLAIWTDGFKFFQSGEEVRIDQDQAIECDEEFENYGFTENHVFYHGGDGVKRLLPNEHPDTFVMYNDALSKGMEAVYVYGTAVDYADAESFEVNTRQNLARDKDRFYDLGGIWEWYEIRPLANRDLDFETYRRFGSLGRSRPSFFFIYKDVNGFYRNGDYVESNGVSEMVLKPVDWPGVDLDSFDYLSGYKVVHEKNLEVPYNTYVDQNNYYLFVGEDEFEEAVSFREVFELSEYEYKNDTEIYYLVVPKDEVEESGFILEERE